MRLFAKLTCLMTLALTVLTGCGGGGNAPSGDSRVTKQEILSTVEQGFSSKEQRESFVVGPVSRFVRPSRSEDYSFFDEYLQVWVKTVGDNNEEIFGGNEEFFLDEALTIPAGKRLRTFTSGAMKQTSEVTAGSMKGYTETSSYVGSESGYTFDVTGSDPANGPFTLKMTYVTATGIATIRSGFRDAQGNTRFFDVQALTDGSYKVRYNNDQLFNFELNYTSEGAGTGTVTGSSELLPATITWDKQGSGTVTFKDGSKQNFTDFRFDI